MSAITFDNASIFGFVNTNSFSTAFTVGSGSNQLLLVGIYITNTATTAPSNPTVDGSSMGGVASNPGPFASYGGLFTYALTVSSGMHTVAFTTGFDVTPKTYCIYSYFNVSKIDKSNVNQGGYSSGTPLTNTMTSGVNNALIWSFGAGVDHTTNNPSFSGPSNNFLTGSGVFSASGSGDFGVQATPTSETASFGANPGGGQACIGMISLAPIIPPAAAQSASLLMLI